MTLWVVIDGHDNLEVFKRKESADKHIEKHGGIMLGETKLRERATR